MDDLAGGGSCTVTFYQDGSVFDALRLAAPWPDLAVEIRYHHE